MDKPSEHKGVTPEEMARWIVSEWRSVRGSDRMLVIAITEALKVIPAAVGDLEAKIAELRRERAALRDALGWMLQDPDSETAARAQQVWDMAMQKGESLETEITALRTLAGVIATSSPEPPVFCADAVVTSREEYAGGRMVKLGVTTSHLDCVSRHVDEFSFRMPTSEEAGVFAIGAPLVVAIRRAGSLGGV